MPMKSTISPILIAATLLSVSPVLAETSPAPLNSIKKMVGYIRFSEKKPEYADRALQFVDMDGITHYLLGSYYSKATAEQRDQFRSLLQQYIKLRAFPQALHYFQKVDISY